MRRCSLPLQSHTEYDVKRCIQYCRRYGVKGALSWSLTPLGCNASRQMTGERHVARSFNSSYPLDQGALLRLPLPPLLPCPLATLTCLHPPPPAPGAEAFLHERLGELDTAKGLLLGALAGGVLTRCVWGDAQGPGGSLGTLVPGVCVCEGAGGGRGGG